MINDSDFLNMSRQGHDLGCLQLLLYALAKAETRHYTKASYSSFIALEVGIGQGKSTLALLKAADEVQFGRVYSLDVDRKGCAQAIERVAYYGYSSLWRPFFVPSFQFEDRETQYDLVFIDGDHTYESVRYDFERFSPQLRVGGLCIFHDTELTESDGKYGVRRFLRERLGRQDLVLIPSHNGMAIWVKEES